MNSKNIASEKIRMGTLVKARPDGSQTAAKYIAQILPHGFESFSLMFWQSIGDTDLKQLAREVKDALGDSGVTISSLGMFGNPLETQPIDLETADGFKRLIDHAHLFGANIIAGFAGRMRGKSIPDSMPRFKEVFTPLAKRAADNGVRIAFENCSMGGNWQSGDWNIAHNPSAWQLMFDAVPAENIGLEWEPCHQMVELIDPMPQLREWSKKIFHVHGKDATIHWDMIKRYGIGGAKPFVFHRTPGFGDCNWTEIISELRRHGYTGCIDIEGWHDPVYRDELEMTGQVHGLNYLKRCRGGDYVPNPV
jgi:sugar phosphate isomerase/epimerase